MTPRRLCRNCRFWYQHGALSAVFNELPPGVGVCALARSDGGEPHPKAKAYAVDYDMNKAELITRPTFGCVEHEPEA